MKSTTSNSMKSLYNTILSFSTLWVDFRLKRIFIFQFTFQGLDEFQELILILSIFNHFLKLDQVYKGIHF